MDVVLMGIGGLLVLFVLAISFLWLSDRVSDFFSRRKYTPQVMEGMRRKHMERLLKPDWAFYERHLQRQVPQSLKDMYSDALLIQEEVEFDDAHTITSFEPLDEAALVDSVEWLGFDIVPFANSNGDMIYLRPGGSVPDAVFINYHDGGEVAELAPDIEVFVSRVKTETFARK